MKASVIPTAFLLLHCLSCRSQVLTKHPSPGRNLYQTYCQSCHGAGGKGDGAVAQYLVLPPADLTRIAARREGVFPEEEIRRIVDGRREVRVHGTSDMPIWGDAFRQEESPEKADENIRRLVAYLKTIQEEKE